MGVKTKKQVVVKLKRRKAPTKCWTWRIKIFFLTILFLSFLGWNQQAETQEYPTRPINMLITYTPGAGVDISARLLAQEAGKILGQEIVPINKPGGGGAVGAGILAASKGDGYTIMVTVSDTLTNTPHLESVPYDPLKDFIPIVQYGHMGTAFCVRQDSPHKSFNDLIEFSRKNPSKITFGSPSLGIGAELTLRLLTLEEKANIIILSYGGSSPALVDLLGGHISSMGMSVPTAVLQLRGGKVRGLAIDRDKRTEAIPDIPTLGELGYSKYMFDNFVMVAAPKGTPPVIVEKLERTFLKAMETSEFRSKMKDIYLYVENPLFGHKLYEVIEQKYLQIGEVIQKVKLRK